MKVEEITKEMQEDLQSVSDLKSLNELRIKYLGKKGIITELNSEIKNVPNEEKKVFGQKVNEVRTLFQTTYDEIKTRLEEEELNQKLASEAIDISLPSTKVSMGAPNILEKLIEEVE